MTDFHWHSLLCVTILASIHIFSAFANLAENIWRTRFLSMAGGVAVSYVFVELMPRLGVSQKTLQEISEDLIPLKERHVYLVAFLGFLVFYAVHCIPHSRSKNKTSLPFVCNMISFLFFNFLVGYEIVDIHDPFIQPLYLFTFAVGLHNFITDHSLKEDHGTHYDAFSKIILALFLYLGFLAGLFTSIPQSMVIYGVAFTAGGMILNVLKYELPKEQKGTSFAAFALGGILYSIILVYQS